MKFLALSVVVLDFVPRVGICVQLSSLLLGCIYIFRAFIYKEKISLVNICSIGFMLYCYCVKDYRVDFWRSLGFKKETANSVMVVTIVSLALSECLNNKEKRDKFISYIVNSCLVLAAYILFIVKGNILIGLHGEGMHDLLEQYGINSNNIGAILSVGFLLAHYQAMKNKTRLSRICEYVLLLFALSSGSRKVIVYILVGITTFYFLKNGAVALNSRTINSFFKTLIMGSILVIAVYYVFIKIEFFYELIGRRIDALITFLKSGDTGDNSLVVRDDMIKMGWRYFDQNPWFGNGLNAFGNFYKSILGRVTYAHNNFIELLVSVGIIGTFLYYVRYAIVLKTLIFKNICVQDAIISAVIIAIICSDVGAVTYYYKFYYMVFGLAAAAVIHRNK